MRSKTLISYQKGYCGQPADIEAAQAFVEMARRWLSWFCEYRSLEFEPRGAGQVAL